MKKVIAVVLCLVFAFSIVSCANEEKEIIVDAGTLKKITPRKVELIAQEEKERYGNLVFKVRWGYENKLSTVYNKAYLVARVIIENYCGEDSATSSSLFTAKVVETYKGPSEKRIVVSQYGTTDFFIENCPLLAPGNEIVMFLVISTKIDSDLHVYESINECLTMIDVVTFEGVDYFIPRNSTFVDKPEKLSFVESDKSGNKNIESELYKADYIWNSEFFKRIIEKSYIRKV